MQTNLLTSGQSDSGNKASSITAAVGADGSAGDLFTKLLVAQIKNQNPLEPNDPSQFVNQLTQLSQMESLQNLAKLGSAGNSMMQSMQVLALGAQVGSKVMARTDHVQLDKTPVSGVFNLQNATTQTTLVLTGTDGTEHKVQLGTRAPGEVAFTVDPAALGLKPGSYAVSVKVDGKETPAIEVAGELGSVKLSATGAVVLNVSNLGPVAPESITQFNGRG